MNRLIILAKNLITHELISGSFYIFIGGLIASFVAFLFNLLMARNLSYADYGILASLISLSTLAIIPTQSLSSIIVRFATAFFTREEFDHAALFYRKMLMFWILSGSLIFLVFLFFSPVISSFLNIKNSLFVIITGLSVGFAYTSIVNTSFLQSLLKFKYLAFTYISSSLVKLLLGIILVLLGYSVGGALWAVAAYTAAIFLLGFFPLKFLIRTGRKESTKIDWREVINYSLPTTLVVLSVTSLITSDIILVKHYFDPVTAGLYGGISLIGRVIFYFTAPIPSVMFPLLVKRQTRQEDFRNLLYLSIFIVVLPSVFITVFYFIYPQLTINLFLGGGEYLRIVSFLGLFGILVSVFSVLNVMVNFFLSIKRTEIAIPCLIASISHIFLITLFHDSFYQIIYISITISSLLLGVLVLYYIKQYGLHYSPK